MYQLNFPKKNLKSFIVLAYIFVFVLSVAVSANAKTIFSWDCENAPEGTLNRSTQNQPFDDVDSYGGGIVHISETYAHGGTKSVRISYPGDEAGTVLCCVNGFTSTPSLYTRRYEYFESGWEANWPVGLKTSRYFTGADSSYAYMSEKLIYQGYGSSCTELYGKGMNNAVGNWDIKASYQADQLFGNGLPYIRTGHWYKFESWLVLNSAVDVSDGTMKIWIDDVLVYSNEALPWKETSRGRVNGDGWTGMWFGGNYSGATCGNPSQTVYRYIDDMYLSTTLDREGEPGPEESEPGPEESPGIPPNFSGE